MMRYGSVCSGIEAASVAWHPLGWRPSFFSEIDPFPRAVLKHRFPDVPVHGDFTTIQSGNYDAIDLLVGGTPCQSFSVAGLRGGMADERGNLALEYLRLAQRLRPRWLVWENVPGVLSSDGGRDFGSILGGMGQLGYGFAYRVLDAQFVRVDGYPRAVPQRRRRVFVVGHLGDWRPAAAVLFERASLCWDTPPRRETGKGITHDVAPCIGASGRGFERTGETRGQDAVVARCDTASQTRLDWETETFVPSVSPTLRAGGNQTGGDRPPGTDVDTCETLVPVSFHARQDPIHSSGSELPLDTDGSSVAVAFRSDAHRSGEAKTPSPDAEGRVRLRDAGFNVYEETAPTLDTGAAHGVGYAMQVRRLTPRECERLMGFPDDWTLVPYRGKPAADGPRYKAIGNSMAVNCMRWIGARIDQVEQILSVKVAAE